MGTGRCKKPPVLLFPFVFVADAAEAITRDTAKTVCTRLRIAEETVPKSRKPKAVVPNRVTAVVRLAAVLHLCFSAVSTNTCDIPVV